MQWISPFRAKPDADLIDKLHRNTCSLMIIINQYHQQKLFSTMLSQSVKAIFICVEKCKLQKCLANAVGRFNICPFIFEEQAGHFGEHFF